jgi:hypothetical protein
MKIELVGLPASGKSTVARQLIKEDDFIRARFNNKLVLIAWFIIFSLMSCRRLFWWLYYWFKISGGLSFKKMIFINAIIHVGAKEAYCYWHSSLKIIVDQGELQNVLILNDKLISDHDLRLFVNRCVGKLDRVIIFSIDEILRQEWIRQRGVNGRERWLDDQLYKQWRDIVQQNFDKLTEYIGPCEGGKTIFIKQPMVVDEAVNMIKQACL